MNAQEIFDKVMTHLATQGHRAINRFNNCVYRSPNGDKCAVGCLIPDDEYTSAFERKSIENIVMIGHVHRPVLNNILAPQLPLLVELQRLHDNWRGPISKFHYAARQVAKNAGLSDAVIDTLEWPEIWQ